MAAILSRPQSVKCDSLEYVKNMYIDTCILNLSI